MALALAFVGSALLLVTLLLASLSRHKKSGTGHLKIVGAIGFVESKLDPEGSVMINGELWRARLAQGGVLQGRHRVQVVSLQGHLLLVEPISDGH